MYATARASAGNHEELQRHITEAMATKAEWESKVQVLQQELQSLANATPELLEQLEYEVEEIKGVVADMETEKQGYYDQTAGLRAAKAQLKERSAEVADVLNVAKVRSAPGRVSMRVRRGRGEGWRSGVRTGDAGGRDDCAEQRQAGARLHQERRGRGGPRGGAAGGGGGVQGAARQGARRGHRAAAQRDHRQRRARGVAEGRPYRRARLDAL